MARGKYEDQDPKPEDQPAAGASRRRKMSDDAPGTTTTPAREAQDDAPGTTTTPPPAEASDDKPVDRAEMTAQLRSYVAKFGSELGAKWFADGKPLAACYGEYVAVLEQRHAADLARERQRGDQLAAAVTELQTVVESMGKAGGSAEPVSGKPAASEAPGKKAAAEYSAILPPTLARVAAGMKMPQ